MSRVPDAVRRAALRRRSGNHVGKEWVPALRCGIPCRSASGTRGRAVPASRCKCQTACDVSAHSRDALHPSLPSTTSLEIRGRGKCRMPDAPAASRANEKEHTSVVTTSSPKTIRHSLRDGFTVSFVLSPVTWLFCHRHRRDAEHRRQLDTCIGVSGPHDFAVRLASFIRASSRA